MIRLPAIIFIINLLLIVSCHDPEEPEAVRDDPQPEETLIVQEGSTINGKTLQLNSENSEAVDFGDMYDIKLNLEGQPAQKNNSYQIRVYIVNPTLSSGVKKFSIQNFSPSRKQISIGLSCIAEIIYQDTIYYGYEGSVSLLDHKNGKMDAIVEVKAASLKGIPLELQGGIIDLKIAAFKPQNCYVDKVFSPYNGGTVARYYYTSEGHLKYAHLGGESTGEGYYFSYLNGSIKEFWHSMTIPTDGTHQVMKSGVVKINSSNRIESLDVLCFSCSSLDDSVVQENKFFYNTSGLLEKVELRSEGPPNSYSLRISQFKYSGKNVIENMAVTGGYTLENYDNKKAPGRQLMRSVHENFFFSTVFPFDVIRLPLSENNFQLVKTNQGTVDNFTYSYDASGNTTMIKSTSMGTPNGFSISYKYCAQ